MKQATLTLDVATNDMVAGMAPTSGTITVTEADLCRMQDLADLCRQNDLLEANFFDGFMEWENEEDTEMDLCSVTTDAVRWRARLKHTDVTFETDDIRLEDIETAMR